MTSIINLLPKNPGLSTVNDIYVSMDATKSMFPTKQMTIEISKSFCDHYDNEYVGTFGP